jgi:hypothetical protein
MITCSSGRAAFNAFNVWMPSMPGMADVEKHNVGRLPLADGRDDLVSA